MSDDRLEESEASLEAAPKRSAEDYVNAANAVIDIAEIAVSFIPGGSAAATVATKALKYALKARLIINHLPNVAPVAEQVASKTQEKARREARRALLDGAGIVCL